MPGGLCFSGSLAEVLLRLRERPPTWLPVTPWLVRVTLRGDCELAGELVKRLRSLMEPGREKELGSALRAFVDECRPGEGRVLAVIVLRSPSGRALEVAVEPDEAADPGPVERAVRFLCGWEQEEEKEEKGEHGDEAGEETRDAG